MKGARSIGTNPTLSANLSANKIVPVYATKNLERMRAFFRFCEQARWIDRNPAVSVKAPKAKTSPTLPFSADEMKRILDACERYQGNSDRMKAFVLTMRHSGLRIGDTIALRRDP